MGNFRPIHRYGFLFPPSVDEWLPQRHMARFVVEVVDGLDLSEMVKSYRGAGSALTTSSVHLTAATSIELDAGECVRLHAPWFEVIVARFAAFAKTVSVIAGKALLNCRLSPLCSELINVVAQRIGVSTRHAHRQIDGTR